MAEIEEMQSRIAAALGRIGQGLDALSADSPEGAEAAAEIGELKQALEDEKLLTAQLEERIRGLKQKHEDDLAEARAQSTGTTEGMAQVDMELQRLRRVTEQLRENNRALREANENNVAEPHLINKSMLAELEALRAERAADVAEASAILGALGPLVGAQEESA